MHSASEIAYLNHPFDVYPMDKVCSCCKQYFRYIDDGLPCVASIMWSLSSIADALNTWNASISIAFLPTTSFLVLNTKHTTKAWNIYEYLPAKSSHHPTVFGFIVRTEAASLLRANKWKDSYAAQLSVFGQTRILPTYSGSHSSRVPASRLRLQS